MRDLARIADRLGLALTERLSAIVPSTFRVIWHDGQILVASALSETWVGSAVRDLVDQEAGELNANIEAAARNALYVAQDYITEVTNASWPTSERAVPHGPGRLPMPRQNAVMQNGQLETWYGDPTDAVLRLEPIAVSYILGGG